jgi:hypothetical protein
MLTHRTAPTNRSGSTNPLRLALLAIVRGPLHGRALLLYTIVVGAHLLEHLAQVGQVYLLDWARPTAGGLLGLVLPGLVASEILHSAWNSLQLTGLVLLAPGMRPAARPLWLAAMVLQTWHWLEHALLQLQYVTGVYLWSATQQMSILERYVPRIELHFGYNLVVFIPTAAALVLHLWSRRRAAV